MRECVKLIPTDLLGEKKVDSEFAQNLWERGRVAEHIWQPHVLRVHPEAFLEVALSIQKLSHERFAAGEVAVRLDPHRAERLPLATLNVGFDRLE